MRIGRRRLIALFLGLAAGACGPSGQPSAPAGEAASPAAQPVRIFAAASLSDVMEELAVAWMATGRPGPVVNLAGSSTLARQIEDGAEADIFISADEQWMDYLADRSLVDVASRSDLLGNSLVLVRPAGGSFELALSGGSDLAAALGDGRLALADPESVPAGRYAKAALAALGMWEAAEPRIAQAQDVRGALRFVTSGEAEAGVVYATDARAAGDAIETAGVFPADAHPAIVYPVALTAEGAAHGEARLFLEFLAGSDARAIFEDHGFTRPGGE